MPRLFIAHKIKLLFRLAEEVTVILFVLISSLCWSALDVLRKILAGKVARSHLVILISLGQIPFFLIWCSMEQRFSLSNSYLILGLLAITLNSLAQLFFMRSIELAPLSRSTPLLAFVPVVTVIVGTFLQEHPTSTQLVGVGLVCWGGYSLHQPTCENFKRMPLDVFRDAGSMYMLFVAILWGIQLPLEKVALMHSTPQLHGLIVSSGTGILFALCCLLKGNSLRTFSTGFRTRSLYLLPLVAGVALASQYVALVDAPVALYETTKRSVGVWVGVLAGLILFQERIDTRQIVSCLTMALGASLVVL